MSALPTLPRRNWTDSVLYALAAALIAASILGLAAPWFLGQGAAQSPSRYAFSSWDEAAVFLSLGLVVLASVPRWPMGAWLAVFPAAWALVALAKEVSGVGAPPAGFHPGSTPDLFGSPARTSIVTAACLLLGSLPLCWDLFRGKSHARTFFTASAGSLIIGMACCALMGYATDLQPLFMWGDSPAVALASAVGLFFLGLALVMLAWREEAERENRLPSWAPLPPVIGALLITLALWSALRDREIAYVDIETRGVMDKFVQSADSAIEHQLNAFEHISRDWADTAGLSSAGSPEAGQAGESRAADAAAQMGESGPLGCVSISYVDPAGRTRWAFPGANRADSIAYDHSTDPARRTAMDQARREGRAVVSATTEVSVIVANGGGLHGPGFVIYAPIIRRGQEAGFVAAEYLYSGFFSEFASETVKHGGDYYFSVLIGGTPVFNGGAARAAERTFAVDRSYVIFDRRLNLTALPSPDELARDRHPLAQAALFAGIALTGFLGLSVNLACRAAVGRRTAEHSNRLLVEENEERRRVEGQLKASDERLRHALAEADAASRAKSEFLASMSHEIRTPMNGIIGMASLLIETEMTAEQRECAGTIRASSEALLSIVNEILDFSKIESGKLEIERNPFNLASCLEETLDLSAVSATAKELEIGYCIAPDVPEWVVGDVTRLWQVVSNLVTNAVKFTSRGAISVEVRRGEGAPAGRICLEFTVRDTGIGIPPERMDRLFKPFSQVDSSTTRRYGGTGLGLAICERLCLLMGGTIRVESVDGKGSAFIFTILAEPAGPAAEPDGIPALPEPLRSAPVLCVSGNRVTQARLRGVLENWGARCVIASDLGEVPKVAAHPALLVIDQEPGASAPVPGSLAGFRCPVLILTPFGRSLPPSADSRLVASVSKPLKNAAFYQAVVQLHTVDGKAGLPEETQALKLSSEFPLKVLLVEDNIVNQKVALGLLERLGYRADLASNGAQAIAMVENRAYDLVLMDLQMPEMDGLEASREIRTRIPADRQPKIIALTANAIHGDRDRCIEAGMNDYVPKPVRLHEVSAAIRRQFARKGQGGRSAVQ